MRIKIFASMIVLLAALSGHTAEAPFSGPQPGEKTTPFKVLEIKSGAEGKERDPIGENGGAPTALVFLHAVERSLVPLLRVIDQYGAERKDLIKIEIIFLFGDKLEGERRVKAVTGSLKLQSRTGLSLDGAEGPGNYGLNKECMMTIVTAKENRVVSNFALVQPGIADAPKVIAALAQTCGDSNPPSVEKLSGPLGRGAEMRRDAAKGEGPSKDKFPGAVPTDERLNTLLRQFIKPDNSEARVNEVLAMVKKHIEGNPDLTKQAIDGWTRILHFGDRYGNEYSRKVGRDFLEKLKTPNPAK